MVSCPSSGSSVFHLSQAIYSWWGDWCDMLQGLSRHKYMELGLWICLWRESCVDGIQWILMHSVEDFTSSTIYTGCKWIVRSRNKILYLVQGMLLHWCLDYSIKNLKRLHHVSEHSIMMKIKSGDQKCPRQWRSYLMDSSNKKDLLRYFCYQWSTSTQTASTGPGLDSYLWHMIMKSQYFHIRPLYMKINWTDGNKSVRVMQKKKMNFWISFGAPPRNVPICEKTSVLKFRSIWTKIRVCYQALKFQW